MEQKKSRMLRLTLMGGQARVFICDTTELAQQARDIHNASNTCSAAMGRMLAATAIMGANLKSEGDRITATINGLLLRNYLIWHTLIQKNVFV